MAAYRYRRLDHDRATFRLLRLHQGIQDDELTCNLFGALLHHDHLIQYEALSYTSGASATPKSVTVDGRQLAITENLHQALISLRRSYTDRILWIDAICIDQGSKKERSHQVARMGDIYKQGDRVIFFLGRATYNTNALMDCMSHVEQERSKFAYPSWARDDKLWMVVQEAIQEKLNKHDIEIPPLGLEDLLNRSWFLRVWSVSSVTGLYRYQPNDAGGYLKDPGNLLQEFIDTAERLGYKEWHERLSKSQPNPESLFVQDHCHFREAFGAAPDEELKHEEPGSQLNWACAAVTLFELHEDGRLHPFAIVIDYKVSMKDSVTIFNNRLEPREPVGGGAPISEEESDWPWRYAKSCTQVSD